MTAINARTRLFSQSGGIKKGKLMSHNTKPTWLLLADGASAQIYVVTYVPLHVVKLAGGELHDNDVRERHAAAHRDKKEAFAARVAEFVNAAAGRHEFGKLLLAAPPRTLAELRQDLSPAVHGLIGMEVYAEWTKLSMPEILKHLEKHAPQPVHL